MRMLPRFVPLAVAVLLAAIMTLAAAVLSSSHKAAPSISAAPATLQTSLGAIKDNTLYQSSSGNLSSGVGEYIFAGRTSGGSLRRGVVAFDIAGNVPAGATITSVTLRLRMSRTGFGVGSRNVVLHRLLADWGEGTSPTGAGGGGGGGGGATATTNDATWVHRFFNTVTWTSNGGDFESTASASRAVGGVGSYTWGSSAQMVADVQGWLDGPASNFGWLVKGDESTRSAKRFDSRENGTVSNRPFLIVDYAPPAPIPPPLGTPTPLKPASGDITSDSGPIFAWTQVQSPPVAVTYTVQIATGAQPATGGFINPVFIQSGIPDNAVDSGGTDVVRFSLPQTGSLSDGVYVWHVRAEDSGGRTGDFSERLPFTVDTTPPAQFDLLLPASGDFTNDPMPFFDWEPSTSDDVISYRLEVTSGDGFSGDIDVVLSGEQTSYTADALADAAYRWRVTALDPAGNEALSETRTFVIDTVQPGRPILVAPSDGISIRDSTPTLAWRPVTGDVTTVSYTLEICACASVPPVLSFFSAGIPDNPISSGGIPVIRFTLPVARALPPGEHTWTVPATDAAGNLGTASATFSFRVLVRGDANEDGLVDMRDVFLVAMNLRAPADPRADLNRDGRTNALDLAIAALGI